MALYDIIRPQMDGREDFQVVLGLNLPAGITIHYDASRMFWTEHGGHKICSSNLDGTGVRAIVTLPSGAYTWGIASHMNQIH